MTTAKILPNNLKIYTDGSCFGNPGPGGYAAIILDSENRIIEKISGYELHTTNNRMEMLAIIRALQWIRVQKKTLPLKINIYSDSSLIVQTMNLGWKKRANLDLWQDLSLAASGLALKFIWVRGHDGDKYNEQCDKIAQAESLKAQKIIQKHPELLEDLTTSSSQNYQGTLF